MGLSLLSCAVATLVLSTPVEGPPCAELPAIADQALTYQKRSFRSVENRCEGMYSRNARGQKPEFRLVSLTRPKIDFPWREDIVLEVSPATPQTERIQVRGRALLKDVAYQMDAFLAPGVPLRWPVEEVLHPKRLDGSKIGLVGWFPDRDSEVYTPLHVAESINATGPALAILEANVRIDYLKWSFLTLEGDRCVRQIQEVIPPDRERAAGLAIEIPFSELGVPQETALCLRVTAVEKREGSGRRLLRTIKVIP